MMSNEQYQQSSSASTIQRGAAAGGIAGFLARHGCKVLSAISLTISVAVLGVVINLNVDNGMAAVSVQPDAPVSTPVAIPTPMPEQPQGDAPAPAAFRDLPGRYSACLMCLPNLSDCVKAGDGYHGAWVTTEEFFALWGEGYRINAQGEPSDDSGLYCQIDGFKPAYLQWGAPDPVG